MQNSDIAWREYDVHAERGSDESPTGGEDAAASYRPADIFAPAEEAAYEVHDYAFDGDDGRAVTISLRARPDYDVSTGLSVWAGAELLCRYLTARPAPTVLRGKRVLELGAGAGLCGLVAARVLGAASVLLTDGDAAVLANLRRNAAAGGGAAAVACHQLIWGAARAAAFARTHGRQDVVLATDCAYVTRSVRPLFATVAGVLAEDGVFLFVHSCASLCSLEEVLGIGRECGFATSSAWYPPDGGADPVFVLRR